MHQPLQLRPLLFGTAWKVLDLLLEAALAAASEVSPQKDGHWSIEAKEKKATAFTAQPQSISSAAWQALMATYAATVQPRHSLVHRAVFTDPAGALVGHDRQGAKLRRVPPDEQEAFGTGRAPSGAARSRADSRGARRG